MLSDENIAKFYGRAAGHWSFLQELRYFDDFEQADREQKIVSLRRTDKNWELLADFEQLEEVTAISPNPKQQEVLFSLKNLKRLRIADVRKTELAGIENLQSLEELVLQNVSGLKNLKRIASLPKLKSLFIENMRSVSDFSDLRFLACLQCLCIKGNIDKNQDVQSLEFLSELNKLRHLALHACRFLSDYPVFRPVTFCENLQSLFVNSSSLELSDWGYVSQHLNRVLIETSPVYFLQGPDGVFETKDDAENSSSKNLAFEVFLKGFRYSAGPKEKMLQKFQGFEQDLKTAQNCPK